MKLQVDHYCFACGSENPIGLKLVFKPVEEWVMAYFTPSREHQGFVNILHGGIVSTLLDEAMAHAVISKGYCAVTARIEISFKKPTVVGTTICLKGKITQEKAKLIKTYAQIEQNGEITAIGTADFIIIENG